MASNDDQQQLSLLLSETKLDETGILWGTVLHAALVLLFATVFISGSMKGVPSPTTTKTSLLLNDNEICSQPHKKEEPPAEAEALNQLKLSPSINDILFAAIHDDEKNLPPLSELLFPLADCPDDAEDDLSEVPFDASNYLFTEDIRKHTTVSEEKEIDEHPSQTKLPHPVVKNTTKLSSDDVIAIAATILNNLDLVPSQKELENSKLPTILPIWLNLKWISQKIICALSTAGSATIVPRYRKDKTSEFLTMSIGSTPPVKLFFKKPKARTKVAIVVDDIGFGSTSTKELLTIDAPLTLAVIPFCRGSVSAVTRGLKKAYELILHMPMEPKRFKNAIRKNIGLFTNQSNTTIKKRLIAALDSLPAGITGVNNHMGSAFTESRTKLTPVMKVLAKRGLFFLDSFTSKDSCAVVTAKKAMIETGVRNFEFIDNKPGVAYSVGQFKKLIRHSRRRRYLITIMHDRKNSITALKKSIDSFRKAGIELTFSSEILEYSYGR